MTTLHNHEDPIPPQESEACDPASPKLEETRVEIRFQGEKTAAGPYDLEQLFVEWAWHVSARRDWDAAVRLLARTLRGLEGAGLIERRTIRRVGRKPHHIVRLTPLGEEALVPLSGDWLDGAER
jgi:hypothetical protein